MTLPFRLRVISSAEERVAVVGSAESDSDATAVVWLVVEVEVEGLLLKPLRGIQPFSPLCIVDTGPRSVAVPFAVAASLFDVLVEAGVDSVLVRPGDEVERVRAGGSAGGGVSERCRWVWV